MRKADTSKKVARTLAKDNSRSKILAKIESHLENGDVTREEIQPLLSEQFITKELPVDVQPLYLNDKSFLSG
jgi:hypothetical protein